MSIDEAIEREKLRARVDRIKTNKKIFHNNDEDEISALNRSAEEHEQLVEWLEELKELREMKETIEYNAEVLEQQGYNKAITDFAERLTSYLGIENATKYGNKNAEQMRLSYGTIMNYEIADAIDDVAYQLKEGGNNER